MGHLDVLIGLGFWCHVGDVGEAQCGKQHAEHACTNERGPDIDAAK
jgi:hypothetical protein